MTLAPPPDPDRWSYIRTIAEQNRPWWLRAFNSLRDALKLRHPQSSSVHRQCLAQDRGSVRTVGVQHPCPDRAQADIDLMFDRLRAEPARSRPVAHEQFASHPLQVARPELAALLVHGACASLGKLGSQPGYAAQSLDLSASVSREEQRYCSWYQSPNPTRMLKMRIFLAQRLIRCSTRLIFCARWVAPELWEHQQ